MVDGYPIGFAATSLQVQPKDRQCLWFGGVDRLHGADRSSRGTDGARAAMVCELAGRCRVRFWELSAPGTSGEVLTRMTGPNCSSSTRAAASSISTTTVARWNRRPSSGAGLPPATMRAPFRVYSENATCIRKMDRGLERRASGDHQWPASVEAGHRRFLIAWEDSPGRQPQCRMPQTAGSVASAGSVGSSSLAPLLLL